MRLLAFTWPYAAIFWVALVVAFLPDSRIAWRRNEGWVNAQDAYSKLVLLLAQTLGMVIAFVLAAAVPLGAIPYQVLCFWLGVIALIAGSLFRFHCRRMLGSKFTGAVIVSAGHTIIERGAYRYVRHPSYTGALIMFSGIGLALANWIGLAALMALVAISFLYRVNVEERALVAVVGDPYRAYMQRTKRFVPFLY